MEGSVTIKAAWIGFAGVIIAALIVCFKPSQPTEQTNVSGSNNVVSINQSGGITAQNFIVTNVTQNITASPQVDVEIKEISLGQADGDMLVSTFEIDVVSERRIPKLAVRVEADSIDSITLDPQNPLPVSTLTTGSGTGMRNCILNDAKGKHILTVRHKKPETLLIGYAVD